MTSAVSTDARPRPGSRLPVPPRVFIAWVVGLYALCRVVTTTILLVVMQHQVPTGMTGGDGVPVTYWNFTALWDGQWYERGVAWRAGQLGGAAPHADLRAAAAAPRHHVEVFAGAAQQRGA